MSFQKVPLVILEREFQISDLILKFDPDWLQ